MDIIEPIIARRIGSKGKELMPVQRRSVYEFLLEYKIPHLSKDRLIKENRLPDHLTCAVDIIDTAKEAIRDMTSTW